MIVKLKCTSNIDFNGGISDYLTIGKVYRGINVGFDLYDIVDDHGDTISVYSDNDAHGEWEIVS